jgi:hypothetical protein
MGGQRSEDATRSINSYQREEEELEGMKME